MLLGLTPKEGGRLTLRAFGVVQSASVGQLCSGACICQHQTNSDDDSGDVRDLSNVSAGS